MDTKPLEKNIKVFEIWGMRRIARIGWKENETNYDVLLRFGTKRPGPAIGSDL